MCDKCDLDLAMYGEVGKGFRCSDVADELLTEQANGIDRFPNRKKTVQTDPANDRDERAFRFDAKPDAGR